MAAAATVDFSFFFSSDFSAIGDVFFFLVCDTEESAAAAADGVLADAVGDFAFFPDDTGAGVAEEGAVVGVTVSSLRGFFFVAADADGVAGAAVLFWVSLGLNNKIIKYVNDSAIQIDANSAILLHKVSIILVGAHDNFALLGVTLKKIKISYSIFSWGEVPAENELL